MWYKEAIEYSGCCLGYDLINQTKLPSGSSTATNRYRLNGEFNHNQSISGQPCDGVHMQMFETWEAVARHE